MYEPNCCTMLCSFGHPMELCCTLLYSRGQMFRRNVALCCKKCCIRLATPLLNMIKQHATMCNKCFMMFYEMLYSFGWGFTLTFYSVQNKLTMTSLK